MLRLQRLLLIAIAICGAGRAFAASQPTYDAQYAALREAVANARLPLDLQQKVLAGAVKARRGAARPARNRGTEAWEPLLDSDRALEEASVPAEVKTKIRAALDKLSAQLRVAPTELEVAVTVRTFSEPTVAAGAGVSIRVDGEELALTGIDGTATIEVSAGDHQFTATSSLDTGGTTNTTIDANPQSPVDIVMRPGGDYALVRDLEMVEAVDGVVPRDTSSFTLRFLDAGETPIALTAILRAQLLHSGKTTDITSDLTLTPAGAASAANMETFRASLVDKYGPFDLRLRGTDALGHTYANTVRFDLGRYHASGTIEAPAGVPTAGIPVRISNQRNGLSFWATTGGGGTVSFPPLLPEGMYTIAAEVVSGDIRYHAYDAFRLEGDNSFALTLRSFVGDSPNSSLTVKQ
jgi:hypothetical protein